MITPVLSLTLTACAVQYVRALTQLESAESHADRDVERQRPLRRCPNAACNLDVTTADVCPECKAPPPATAAPAKGATIVKLFFVPISAGGVVFPKHVQIEHNYMLASGGLHLADGKFFAYIWADSRHDAVSIALKMLAEFREAFQRLEAVKVERKRRVWNRLATAIGHPDIAIEETM